MTNPTDTTYRVTYRLTTTPERGTAIVSRRHLERHADGSFTSHVALHEGYSNFESIRRIIAIAHPAGPLTADDVEVISLQQTAREPALDATARCPRCGRRQGYDGHRYGPCEA